MKTNIIISNEFSNKSIKRSSSNMSQIQQTQTRKNKRRNTLIVPPLIGLDQSINSIKLNQQILIIKRRQKSMKTYNPLSILQKFSKQKHVLTNNNERKMFLMISLIDNFVKKYQQSKLKQQQETQRLHQTRRNVLNIHPRNLQSYKTIQPTPNKNINMQQSFLFFSKLKQKLVSFLNQQQKALEKKQKQQLINHLNPKQTNEQSHLRRRLTKKVSTFLTNFVNQQNKNQQHILNCLKPQDILKDSTNLRSSQTIRYNQSDKINNDSFKFKTIFRLSKANTNSKPLNKYNCRKKQEIALFLNLNQKTSNLQNFRSDGGKLFKFNETLKITIKNIITCRITVIKKRNLILKCLQQKWMQHSPSSLAFAPQHHRKSSIFTSISHINRCQKLTRLVQYLNESTQLFNKLQKYLLTFIFREKCYMDYLSQMQKNQLHIEGFQNNHKQENQIIYDNFIAKCLHLIQIIKLYFYMLTQFRHQNIDMKNLKLINKTQLDKQNKTLIQLRYVLTYLQQECQNSIEKQPHIASPFTYQLISSRPIQPHVALTNSQTQKQNIQKPIVLQKCLNPLQNCPLKRVSKSMLSILPQKIQSNNPDKLSYNPDKLSYIKKTNQIGNKRLQTLPNCEGKDDLDKEQLWKIFYAKKFTHKAMRLKLD